MIAHLVDDAQIFLALAGGWAVASFAVCRAKYAEDWFDPWFTMAKVVSVLALAAVAENERRTIYAWWSAAPVLVSTSAVSTIAWGLTRWNLRRRRQDTVLDLELRGDAAGEGNNLAGSPRVLLYWGVANLVLIVSSFVVAAIRGR